MVISVWFLTTSPLQKVVWMIHALIYDNVLGFLNHTTNPLPWTQNFQIVFKGCLYVCVHVNVSLLLNDNPSLCPKRQICHGKSPSSLALLMSLMLAIPLEGMECVLPTHRHQLRQRAARNSPFLPGKRCLAIFWLDCILMMLTETESQMSRHFLLLLYYWPEEDGDFPPCFQKLSFFWILPC